MKRRHPEVGQVVIPEGLYDLAANIDTVVVGASAAGLAVATLLQERVSGDGSPVTTG